MSLERSYAGKRILVTGGAGFIGSHLCERLLAEGAEVISVDNYFTGGRRNIAHLLSNPLFEAMRHDVTFPLYVEVDAIFNLACPASPVHYRRDPVQTTKTSVHSAINMLGLASGLASASCRHRPAKSTAIRWCTPSRKNTGATSTRSEFARATTRASAARKPTMIASSSMERTADLASLGPVRRSATVSRRFHFATVFWLIPWRFASALRLS